MAKIFKQGDLDGLCGVYSLINACCYFGCTEDECEELFTKSIKYLNENNKLETALLKGLSFLWIRKLVKNVFSKFLSDGTIIFERKSPSLNEYWNTISKFLDENKGGCVFVRFEDSKDDHFSIITKASDSKLTLHDSSNFLPFKIEECTVGKPKKKGVYQFYPKETYFFARPEKKIRL